MIQNNMICIETPVRHFLYIPVTLYLFFNIVISECSITF